MGNWLYRVQTRASTLQAKHQIQLSYLQQTTAFLVQATMELEFSLKTTIRSLAIPTDKPEEMQWEWRPHSIQLPFLSDQLENETRDGAHNESSQSRDFSIADSSPSPSHSSSSEDEDTLRRPQDHEIIQTQLLELLVKSIARSKEPKPEAPKPKPYKGDPEDLERFT